MNLGIPLVADTAILGILLVYCITTRAVHPMFCGGSCIEGQRANWPLAANASRCIFRSVLCSKVFFL